MPGQSLNLSNVTFDPLLTRLSVGFMQDRADAAITRAFPIVPVGSQSAQYVKWDKNDLRRIAMRRRGLGQESETATFGKTDQSFNTEEWSLKVPLDETLINAAAGKNPVMNLRRQNTRYLSQQAMLHLDDEFSSLFMAASEWTTTKDGGTSDFTQWENDNGTPYDNVDTWKNEVALTGVFEPNIGILGKDVWVELKNHTETFNRIAIGEAGGPSRITTDLVAQAMGLDAIIVPGLSKETEPPGATSSPEWIFPKKDALFVYAPDNPGIMTPSGGYIFVWTEAFNGQATDELGTVMQRIERGEKHSEEDEIRMHYDMKKVAADVGVHVTAAVA